MKQLLKDLLGFIKAVFVIPAAILLIIWILFKQFVMHQKEDDRQENIKRNRTILALISAIIWLFIGWGIYYSYQYEYIPFVYACPSENVTKCYRVKADFSPRDCDDSGHCSDSYINKIYFPNGGYITFQYCKEIKDDKWFCVAEKRDDGTWNIELSEFVKLKKH